jgi:four helix bundle protein
MARDYRRLDVFHLADDLAIEMYRFTAHFPDSERYGLAGQMRRAAVSAPANIVEGAERSTQKDFLRHLDIAAGSAAEARYLLSLSRRLGYDHVAVAESLEQRYDGVVRSLQNLRASLRRQPD